MRKQECVHLHALLVEVTRHAIEREDLSASALARYDAVGTRPTNIHESKQAHWAAVRTLASTLDRELDSQSGETPDHLVG